MARTAATNAAVSGVASVADSVVNGEEPSVAKVVAAEALGGITSAAEGVSGASKVFADKIQAVAIGTPAGIGAHIASTTGAATQVVVNNAAITALSQNIPDVVSSVADKKIEKSIDNKKD